MPPSPALGYSPGRGQKVEIHRRGRSLEDSLLVKDKEDDLELFSELQSKERENSLLQSTDDFDSTFSMRLKHLSDVKLGIPSHGESSDLLNVDGEKNDYDWLLTPPETPLFPSLDDDTLSANVATRGRPRSQPISTSRSSTMDKTYRSRRGSPSPNRISRSPCSVTSSTSRGRPSSSPTSSHRSVTPSLRSSPPPNKGLLLASRSSSSNPRRMSTGSSNHVTSPIRTGRGNSPSQKIRAWQSNILGFSSDAPPNLRTSFVDRPASYVRGSSPASRSSRRKSTSPTTFRRMQDLDHGNSSKRASLNLGGHADFESVPSYQYGNTDKKKVGVIQSNRNPGFSRRPAKVFSPSSATKKSFDSVLQHMEHRKTPPNMFRPLLSSVPTSTFNAGTVPAAHQSLISQNSSAPTSSNTSLDQGHAVAIKIVLDVDADLPEKELDSDAMDEDRMDCARFNTCHPSVLDTVDKDEAIPSAEPLQHSNDKNTRVGIDFSENCDMQEMNVCDRCGCSYNAVSSTERECHLCINCIQELSMPNAITQSGEQIDSGDSTIQTNRFFCPREMYKQHATSTCNEREVCSVLEERLNVPFDENACIDSLGGSYNEDIHLSVSRNSLDCEPDSQKSIHDNESWTPMADLSKAIGLEKSSSCKASGFKERSFSTSTVTYDDLVHARDNMRSSRSSVGYLSSSASSSVDFSSSRVGETPMQRKLGLKKTNTGVKRVETHGRSQSCSSFLNQHIQGGEKSSDINEFSLTEIKRAKQVEGIVGSKNKLTVSQDNERDASSLLITNDHSSFEECYRSDLSALGFSGCQLGGVPLEDKSVSSLIHHERISSTGNGNVVCCLNEDQSNLDDDISVAPSRCNDGAPKHFSASEVELDPCSQNEPVSGSENLGRSKYVADAIPGAIPPEPEANELSSIEVKPSSDSHILPEESVVVLSDLGENNPRSLTLEEATDRILFCSSLVNDMVYHAATIAVEKESSIQMEGSKPTVTVLGRSNVSKIDPLGDMKLPSKFHKVKQKQASSYTKVPSVEAENDENKNEAMMQNYDVPNKNEGPKPPKLESKCNCRIM